MRYATRRRALAFVLAVGACGGRTEQAPAAGRTDEPGSTAPTGMAWRVDTLDTGTSFRAFGFGGGDTIWGIDRGRLAFFAPGAGVTRLPHVAWDVQMRRHEPTWTDESGVWQRDRAGRRLLVDRTVAAGDYLGPDVLWSPDGQRALLTWTMEGPVRNGIMEGDSVRWLQASVPGLGGAPAAIWLDDRRIVVPVTRWSALSGASGHRESGYRADLAVIDVIGDSLRIITAARDGEFFTPAGVLVPHGVIAGVRTEGGASERHVAIDTARWTVSPHRLGQGRASAHFLQIAVLRPLTAPGAGGEPEWQLDLAGFVDTTGILRLRGHAVRTIWDPGSAPRLLIAQESEAAGNRTWLIRAYVTNP